MIQSIISFFNSENFMPHGHCFFWEPGILWMHVISDAGIAAAYFSIPFVIFYFTRNRKDLPFQGIFLLFGAFILLCGATHLISIWVLWYPDYALEGVVKALTAIVSIATFFVAIKIVPKALLLSSPDQLSELNKKLEEKNRELATLYEQSRESGHVRLNAVVNNVIDGIITISERGIVESFNPACERIFGYASKEVIGNNIKMLMPEPYHSEHDGYLGNYHSTGVAKIIGIGREVSGKRKDGTVFPMDLSVSGFELEGKKHFSGIIRDITERKKNEAAREASENKLHAVLDNVIDGIIAIDERGNVESFNQACENIFGYKAEEVIGQNIKMLMPEPYHSEHDGYLHNYNNTGIAKIIGIGREVRGKRKDGSVFPMDLSVSAFQLQDGRHFSGIIRDISERKENEKVHEQLRQAQKMESLGQLTGGIAHDFNNLLAVILGNLDFIFERTKEDDPLREFIKPSIEAAEHGAGLTKQLLAFGRKQALQPKIISLNELMQYFTVLVKHTLGERIEIIQVLHPELWNVNVDPSLLQNALLNLAVNARDAMPNGGKIIIETSNINLNEDYTENNTDVVSGDYVVVAISDTGEGMSHEVIEKAFEPFFTTKEVGKGSGLGLSMVYGFVKQSNGHIKIYSELGHGTSVKIYLPRAEGDIQKAEQQTESPVSAKNKAKLVLVVEDNKEVLKLTSSIVESLGYNILIAETGDAAMKILEEHSDIDLLLTDVMLPGVLNGPALAKRASALYPNLKVLFNSGYAEHAIIQSGILEEGVNLISKPFRKQQLANKIAEMLK